MVDLETLLNEIVADLERLGPTIGIEATGKGGKPPIDHVTGRLRDIADDVELVVQKMFVMDRELARTNRHEGEYTWFSFLEAGVRLSGARALAFFFWLPRTRNTYAKVFQQGIELGKVEARPDTRRAADGRRLIGATSRDKVRHAAEKYRHMSKEAASVSIADDVRLAHGTVKRYLSELYPGEKWKNVDS